MPVVGTADTSAAAARRRGARKLACTDHTVASPRWGKLPSWKSFRRSVDSTCEIVDQLAVAVELDFAVDTSAAVLVRLENLLVDSERP